MSDDPLAVALNDVAEWHGQYIRACQERTAFAAKFVEQWQRAERLEREVAELRRSLARRQ